MGNQVSRDLDPNMEGTFGIIQLQLLVLQEGILRSRIGKKVTRGHMETAHLTS